MAIRYAITAGNFSDTATWSDSYNGSGGFGVPTTGDTAYANGYTVTIDVDATCLEVRNDNLGPELVTNGTFDADTGWTKGSNWTISGGVASRTSYASFSAVSQSISISAGDTCYCIFNVTALSGGNGYTQLFSSSTTSSITTTGQHSLYAPYNNATLFYIGALANVVITIDNVSIKKVLGGSFTLNSGVTLQANVYAGSATCVTYSPTNGNSTITGNIVASYTTTNAHGLSLGMTNSTLTINGNVTGGTYTSGTSRGINISGTGSVIINGNVTGGTGYNDSNGITSSGGATLTVNGAVTGGSGVAGARGIYISSTSGTVTVNTGPITGGPTSTNYGIYISGTFAGIINCNCNVVGGSASASYGIADGTVACTLNVSGNVTGGSNSTAYGIITGGTETVNITGTCTGATAPAVYHGGTGTVTITGNVTGSSSASSYGVYNYSTGTIIIVGNLTGGNASSNTAGSLINYSTGLIIITGDVTGGGSNASYGVLNMSTGSITINGNAYAGNSSLGNAYALYNYSTAGIIILNGTIFSSTYGNGSSGIYPTLSASNSQTGTLKVRSVQLGSRGYWPISGPVFFDVQPDSFIQWTLSDGSTTRMYPYTSTTQPLINNVLKGVVYDNGSKTGTMAIPPVETVDKGVPVGNSVGTGAITPSSFWNYDNKQLTLPIITKKSGL